MKKTLKTMLAIVAGAAAITACQKENLIEGEVPQQAVSELKPMTFTAYMEGQGPASKTTIDGSHYTTDQLYDVLWSAGEKIGVYDGATENNGCQEFTLTSGEGSTIAEFSGNAAEADTYFAIYPYAPSKSETLTEDGLKAAIGDDVYNLIVYDLDMWREFMEMYMSDMVYDQMNGYGISSEAQEIIIAYLKGEPIKSGPQRNGDKFENITIPSEQTVAAGQCVDPKAMLMIAKSDNTSLLSFKNVCAYVRVTPKFDCYAICIRSNGSGDLAGTVTLDYNDGVPSTEVTENGSTAVFLTGSITAGNTYYIAVRPETTTGGFTIEFLTSDRSHYYGRSSDNNLGLARSEVVNLGEFSTDGTWTYKNVPTTGNDGNGHDWRLLTPTLKFATVGYGSHISGYNVVDESKAAEWGDGWAFPSSEDITPIAYGKGHKGTQVYGLGVLKYVEPQITITAQSDQIWLSGTFQLGNDTIRYTYSFKENMFKNGYVKGAFAHTFGLYYKYTK